MLIRAAEPVLGAIRWRGSAGPCPERDLMRGPGWRLAMALDIGAASTAQIYVRPARSGLSAAAASPWNSASARASASAGMRTGRCASSRRAAAM